MQSLPALRNLRADLPSIAAPGEGEPEPALVERVSGQLGAVPSLRQAGSGQLGPVLDPGRAGFALPRTCTRAWSTSPRASSEQCPSPVEQPSGLPRTTPSDTGPCASAPPCLRAEVRPNPHGDHEREATSPSQPAQENPRTPGSGSWARFSLSRRPSEAPHALRDRRLRARPSSMIVGACPLQRFDPRMKSISRRSTSICVRGPSIITSFAAGRSPRT